MIRDLIKWVVFKCIYPVVYWCSSRKVVNDRKIIFVENHQPVLTDNFTLLYEQFQQMGYEIHVHYLRVAHSGWGTIIRKSISVLRDIGDAAVVFLNESNSLFGAFTLRKETQMVQVWHACGAFKKWGCSVADKTFGDSMKDLKQYSGHRNYTLVPVSGEEVCFAYEEAFGLEKDCHIVRPLGVSRTDVLFDSFYRQQAFDHLYEWKPEWRHKKILLYLPTFRGSIKEAKAPDVLDWKMLERLEEPYVIVIRNHPFISEVMDVPDYLADKVVDIKQFGEDSLSTNEWMIVSEACITDYSSVVFEYSLLNKPIYFLAYDLDSYYDERGFYFPYEAFVPGPIIRNTQQLLEQIQEIERFDYTRLTEFRKHYMNGCDGMSTKRIVQTVTETIECKQTGGVQDGRK